MKIIQITPHYPPHLGGMEKRVKDLCEKLSKKGYYVNVITSDLGYRNKIKSKKNLKIDYLKSFEFANNPLNLKLSSKIKSIRNAIFHLHLVDSFYSIVSYTRIRKANSPYIAHIRGDIQPSGKLGFLLPLYKKLFLKRILQNADRVIALNQDYKDLFTKKYNLNKDNVIVIPNATSFKISKRINSKLHNPVRLLFVGRFSVDKNLEFLIKSLKYLKEQNFILYLVGEGPLENSIRSLIKKEGINKKIVFKGRLEGEKLYQAYLNSDIILLPSKVECFSSVLLEAMATGRPIIASNVKGSRNVIKDDYNGLLVNPTPMNLANTITRLIGDKKLREKLIKNGYKEVKRYSWDNIIKQTEEVYRQVWEEHQKKKNKKNKKKVR
ncbi:glycosyltransferase family 4 protein [Candidatus Pacearchaeota archaeon]|nr:glycosyltransferase family 4 protein [Candidatus Pacearchaeota archaeon]